MSDFYHIFIKPNKGVTSEQVEEKMNLAVDWFRCTPNVWIVYTTSDADKWLNRLKPFVEPDGSLFICKLDIARRNGWMNNEFWKWIKAKPNTSRR